MDEERARIKKEKTRLLEEEKRLMEEESRKIQVSYVCCHAVNIFDS